MRICPLLHLVFSLALALLLAACSGSSSEPSVGNVCRPLCTGDTSCINGRCVANVGDADEAEQNDSETADADTPDGDLSEAETGEDAETESEAEAEEAESEPDFDIPEIDGDFDFALLPCDILGTVADPELTPIPTAIDFGALSVSETKTSLLKACNTGNTDLHLTALQFSPETSREFLKNGPPLPFTIPSGFAVPIYLTYYALDQNPDSGKLLLLSNDPAHSSVEVPLTSSVKSEPLVIVQPEILQFPGATAVGESAVRRVTFENIGRVPTSIQSLTLQSGGNGAFTLDAFSDTDGPLTNQSPWSLPVGGKLFVDIRLTMPATTPGNDTLTAVWAYTSGSRTLTVQLEVSDASICAIPDAGPDQTVRPLDTVNLDGSASRDPNATSVLAYKWSWVEKPENASRAVLLDEADNNIEDTWTTSATPHFFAIQAGTYKIRLTLQDIDKDCTEARSDDVIINVVPDETIHLQLNWSKPGNDHDLHLISPGGHHSRQCGQVKNGTDCCWSNCATNMGTNKNCPARGCPGPLEAPDWGAAGSRDDDPTLDIDDREGKGPENINLSLPVVGDYQVTVENYNGLDSVAITVKVYLFGSLAQTFRYGPPFTDNRLPAGYHWNVCKLHVIDDSHIEVVPIGTMEISPENQ